MKRITQFKEDAKRKPSLGSFKCFSEGKHKLIFFLVLESLDRDPADRETGSGRKRAALGLSLSFFNQVLMGRHGAHGPCS